MVRIPMSKFNIPGGKVMLKRRWCGSGINDETL